MAPSARLWLGAATGTLATFGLVALACAALIFPDAQSDLPSWLQPSAPVTAAAVGLLVAVAFLLFAVPRWEKGQSLQVPALALGACVAASMGLASTVRCSDGEDWILTPVWNTMTMFVGTSPDLYSESGTCAGGVPLAMQLGRFVAVATVFGAAISLAVQVLSDRFVAVRDTFAEYRDVVIGVDEASLPLIETLVTWADPLEAVIVLAGPGEGAAAAKAQEMGAQVRTLAVLQSDHSAPGDDRWRSHLQRFLTKGGRGTATTVWVMDADPARAAQTARAVREILAGTDRSTLQTAPRVVVRIDDRRAAERLRAEWVLEEAHRQVGSGPDLRSPVLDPVCASEVTAAELVGRVAQSFAPIGDYTLVVCGDTPLAEAVALLSAARLWEVQELREAWQCHVAKCEATPKCTADDLPQDPNDLLVGGRLPSRVIMMDGAAGNMIGQVLRGLPIQQRTLLEPILQSVHVDWRRVTASDLDAPGNVAFILTERIPPEHSHLPARLLGLARPTQRATVWLQPPGATGPRAVSLNPGEQGYAENILLGGTLPEDSWTRAARHVHERYRRVNWAHPQERGAAWWQPAKDARRAWWTEDPASRLPRAIRTDNLDSIRQTLLSVAALGWRWRRDVEAQGRPGFSDEELERIRAAEYLRWRRGQPEPRNVPAKWPKPSTTNQSEQGHREFTATTVDTTLRVLASYGYVPTREG